MSFFKVPTAEDKALNDDLQKRLEERFKRAEAKRAGWLNCSLIFTHASPMLS